MYRIAWSNPIKIQFLTSLNSLIELYLTTCLKCSEQSIQNKECWIWFIIHFVCVNPKHLLLWHLYLNTFYHDWENKNKKQRFHCHSPVYIRLSFSHHHPLFISYRIVSNVSILTLIHYHTTITYQNAFLFVLLVPFLVCDVSSLVILL